MAKTETKDKILQLLKAREFGVSELGRELRISTQAIHRHLKSLLGSEKIIKLGSPPKVFYALNKKILVEKNLKNNFRQEVQDAIEENFIYVSPQGGFIFGTEAFNIWAKSSNPQQDINSLAEEYYKVFSESRKFYNDKSIINATARFKTIDKNVSMNEVYYKEFYSLPKFGKTKLGAMVLYAKQSQDLNLINNIAIEIKTSILHLIKKYKIEAIVGIPHSIPRKVQFLDEILRNLNYLNLPRIKLIKAYAGGIPIPQKSLSKLHERIENAKNTIIIPSDAVKFKRVLLIDDAVGSGATLNETAKKLKATLKIEKIIGFSIVGSYKGFEVIKEV